MSKALKAFLNRSDEGLVNSLARIERTIASDSPRGAAIVAAALVEDFLSGAISAKMIKMGKSESDALFDYNGPLGSFAAKIKIARAFGIIGNRTEHDLNLLREIRNAFAHTLRDLQFDTPELSEMCRSFHCSIDLPKSEEMTTREIFAACVDRLTLFLMSKLNNVKEGQFTKTIGKQLN